MKNWFLLIPFISTISCAQTIVPHPNAHAHNDYEHNRPLFDALDNGFLSVEADVHLVDHRLLVSHDRPDGTSKTLEALYLRPLDSIRIRQGGIYSGSKLPLVLLIDIKTNGESTFKALVALLARYEQCIQTPAHAGVLQIIISGNRPIDLIRNDPNHLATIDGRPEDIGAGFTSLEMPIISENYTKITKWNGQGSPTADDLIHLRNLVTNVHNEHKKLRLWGTPDNENTWEVLLDAGTDMINTDKLNALNIFLSRRGM